MLANGIDVPRDFVRVGDPTDQKFVRTITQSGRVEAVLCTSDHIAAQLTLVIAAALQAGGQDDAPAAVWAAGLVGMVRAAADQWLTAPASMTRATLTTHLTDLAWSGLSSAWTPPETP